VVFGALGDAVTMATVTHETVIMIDITVILFFPSS